jgi:hypothetical protein
VAYETFLLQNVFVCVTTSCAARKLFLSFRKHGKIISLISEQREADICLIARQSVFPPAHPQGRPLQTAFSKALRKSPSVFTFTSTIFVVFVQTKPSSKRKRKNLHIFCDTCRVFNDFELVESEINLNFAILHHHCR